MSSPSPSVFKIISPAIDYKTGYLSCDVKLFAKSDYDAQLYEGPGKKPLVWSVQGCGPDVDGVYVPSEWKDIVIRASSNGAAVAAHRGVDRAIDYVKRFCSLLHESCQARNAMLKKAIERDVKSASDEAREPVKQLRERVRVHKQVERMSDAEAAVFEVELKAAENMYLPEGMQDSLGDDEETQFCEFCCRSDCDAAGGNVYYDDCPLSEDGPPCDYCGGGPQECFPEFPCCLAPDEGTV